MAAKGASELSHLFSALQRAAEDEDDQQVLDISKKILELSGCDADALHCQLVSLIHLSRFDSALQLIGSLNKNKKNGEKFFQLEEAYCLYRQDKYEETLSVLSSMSQSDAKVLELMAQVAYRQEKYLRAVKTYQKLLDVNENRQERLANYYAALSLTSSTHQDGSCLTAVDSIETMEQCFNLACCKLVAGHSARAMQLLTKAETLYRASLEEEGYTEEEIAEEMVIIQVQKGYCYQVKDLMKEAMSCYNTTLKLRPDDPTLITVISNNILALNRDKDVFDSKKKVKVLASEGGARKLTRLQKQKILFNRCMFALQTNQLEQCRELASMLKTAHSHSDLSLLAEVALLSREKKGGAAIELLSNHLKSFPQAGVGVYATLAQFQMAQGNYANVCATLQSVPTFSCHVGVASTVASLRASLGEVGVAVQVLEDMLEYWMRCGQGEEPFLSNLVKQVAKFYLSHGCSEAAAKLLQRKLDDHDSLDLRALLISAFSQYDPQAAEQASRSLPPFSIPANMDVDQMEQTPVFRHSRRPAADRTEQARGEPRAKKKKKRKPRLPKNFDPNITPDAERWIPLRERSYYRKSRRKGGVAPSVRGTQGSSAASVALMSQLDASKSIKSVEMATDGKSEGSAVSSPKPKSQQQQSKKKQKKKKGGKW